MNRDKVEVQNVNHPGKTRMVDARMYAAMKRAYLAALPTKPPGLTIEQVTERLTRTLPQSLFPAGAKAGWWAKTVQLDLEAKKLIARSTGSPIRLYKTERA